MESVVLVIHLFLALAIIGLVLLQRSEGGGLGIGGGGGMGNLASAASTANILSRTTAICAALFFATSLTLGILAGTHVAPDSIIDRLDENLPAATAPADVLSPVTGEEGAALEAGEVSAPIPDAKVPRAPEAPIAE